MLAEWIQSDSHFGLENSSFLDGTDVSIHMYSGGAESQSRQNSFT